MFSNSYLKNNTEHFTEIPLSSN